MKCPACGAEMHLMQVVLDDTMRHAPAVERHVFKSLGSTNSVTTTHLKAGVLRLRVH
jgi:hypothetical protein